MQSILIINTQHNFPSIPPSICTKSPSQIYAIFSFNFLFLSPNSALHYRRDVWPYAGHEHLPVFSSQKESDYPSLSSCQLPRAPVTGEWSWGTHPPYVLEFWLTCAGLVQVTIANVSWCIQQPRHIQKPSLHSSHFHLLGLTLFLPCLVWSSLNLRWWEVDLHDLPTAKPLGVFIVSMTTYESLY